MTDTSKEALDRLENDLFDSDAASALTNKAARTIAALRQQLHEAQEDLNAEEMRGNAERQALRAENDALRAAKWDVQHTDTMNDMVLLGIDRDEWMRRAECAEAQIAAAEAAAYEMVLSKLKSEAVEYADLAQEQYRKGIEFWLENERISKQIVRISNDIRALITPEAASALAAREAAAHRAGKLEGLREAAAMCAPAANSKCGLWAQRLAKLRAAILARAERIEKGVE